MYKKSFQDYLGPEDRLQIEVCTYVKWKYRGAVIHHSPNSGKRTPFEQFKLKQLHCSPGFPDVFILFNKKLILVELKAKGGKPTEYQKAWIDTLNSNGIPAKVCVGYDEATQFIDEHLTT